MPQPKKQGSIRSLVFLLVARIRPSSATLRVAELGSHFASKAMGARSREPRAKIFALGETHLFATFRSNGDRRFLRDVT